MPACQAVPQATSWMPTRLRTHFSVERDAVEVDVALVLAHARADRVADRARLLEDLLLHEAVVAALLRLDRIPLDQLARALDVRAVEGRDRDAFARHHGDLGVLQDLDLRACRAGWWGCRRRRSSRRRRARPRSGCRRSSRSRSRSARSRRRPRSRTSPRAARSAARTASSQRLAALALLVDTRCEMISVSVSSLNTRARARELVAQRAEVLDDAVADHRDGAGEVRVGVALARLAVRGPARVADAERPGERHVAQRALQVHELALRADDAQLAVLPGSRRRPSRSRDTRGAAGRR